MARRLGLQWDANSRCWWTQDWWIAQSLRQWATPAAAQRIEEEQRKAQALFQKSMATHPQNQQPLPIPPGKSLFPFQVAAIEYAMAVLEEGRGVIIGDPMGSGKTIVTSVLFNLLKPPSALIVCPASVKLNWASELESWLIEPPNIHVAYGRSSPLPPAPFVIANYDIIDARFLSRSWEILVLDEAHLIKNYRAKRTKAVRAIEAQKKILLTGTPLLNRPSEFFPLLNLVHPSAFASFMQFARRYCNATLKPWGWDYSGFANLKELNFRVRGSVMIRRDKESILSQLPPAIRQVIVLPPQGFEKALREENTILAQYQSFQEAKVRAPLFRALQQIAIARHLTALAKVPLIVDMARQALEEKEKLVIFGHHHDVLQGIAQGLHEFPHAILYGETPTPERQRIIQEFQEGNLRVLLGSLHASGVGINLHRADTAIFAEIDWTPAILDQAEGRLHRIGQRQSCLFIYPVISGSIDAKILKVLTRKEKVIQEAIDTLLAIMEEEDAGGSPPLLA